MQKTKKITVAKGSQDEITDTIVKKMWQLINRDVNDSEISKVAKSLKATNIYDTIKNVFNYVRKNYHYKSDPEGIEHITAPAHIIRGDAPYMDCDELVNITACLLLNLKIPVLIKTIAWRMYAYTHVVLEAELEANKWIVLDPTRSDGFGYQELKVIREKRYKR